MAFDRDPDAPVSANAIHVRHTVQNSELARRPGVDDRQVEQLCARQLAAMIANTPGVIEKRVGKYETEWNIDLFVLTGDQLAGLVQRRAVRLVREGLC